MHGEVCFAADRRVLRRDKARGLKAHDIAAAMKAVTSALAGGVITPGEAATIAAEFGGA